MSIEDALRRIKELKTDVHSCADLISIAQRGASRGDFRNGETVITADIHSGMRVSVPIDDFIDLLDRRKEKARAELNRLEPVIYMANLALKGMTDE